jgi:hypothetical protein
MLSLKPINIPLLLIKIVAILFLSYNFSIFANATKSYSLKLSIWISILIGKIKKFYFFPYKIKFEKFLTNLPSFINLSINLLWESEYILGIISDKK